jgi:hypothetical protein
VEFLVALRKIRLVLDNDGSGLSFDIIWEGVSPAFEEGHPRVRRCADVAWVLP